MSIRTKALLAGVLTLTFLAPLLCAQAISDADRQRFEQIKAKHDRGEQVTPEEQKFAQSIMARMNQGRGAQRPAGIADADWQRFEQIRARHDRGEPITPEDQKFAQPILARMNQGQGGGNPARPAGTSDADWQRLQQIRAKVQRGEQPTPEERQFAQSIMGRAGQ